MSGSDVEEERTQKYMKKKTNEKNIRISYNEIKGIKNPSINRLPPTGRTQRGQLRVLCFVLEMRNYSNSVNDHTAP